MENPISHFVFDLEWSIVGKDGAGRPIAWHATSPESTKGYAVRETSRYDYSLDLGGYDLGTFPTSEDARNAARQDLCKRLERFLARSGPDDETVLDSLLDDLASLSSYVGSGLPDRIDPKDIAGRIRHGIDFLTDALADDARRYRALRLRGVMLEGNSLFGKDLDEAIDARPAATASAEVEIVEPCSASEPRWTKSRKGSAIIHRLEGCDHAIVDKKGYGRNPGITWNSIPFESVEAAKSHVEQEMGLREPPTLHP